MFEYYRKTMSAQFPLYACQYGEALNYQDKHNDKKTIAILEPYVNGSFQHDPFMNLALAQSYESVGKKEEAKHIYQKFYDVSPNNTAIVDQYSDYLESNDPKKNLSMLIKAIEKLKMMQISVLNLLVRKPNNTCLLKPIY